MNLSSMTLREKIAHMIVVRGARHMESIEQMLKDGEIGILDACVVLYVTGKGSYESGGAEDVVDVINRFKKMSKLPLQLYLDAEWGVRMRYQFATPFPHQMAVGATRSLEIAYQNGEAIAKELRALGYTITSNPVLDVNTNPKNPIINTRAFSDDTDLVIELSRAYIRGMQNEGVITAGKHYPGHGDTETDSHVSMPIVRRERESIFELELAPYAALASELWGVMTAHILFPALLGPGEKNIPATLSRTIIYDILRRQLGYEGLIISDSLTMRGIKTEYGIERAAILAILAGHDIILQDYESDPKITFDAVYQAAERGDIPMEYIDESVARILKFREKTGCDRMGAVDLDKVLEVVGSEEIRGVARLTTERAVTMIQRGSLPLPAASDKKTLFLATVSEKEAMSAADLGLITNSSADRAAGEYQKRSRTDFMKIPESLTDAELQNILEKSKGYDRVVFASFIRVTAYKKGSGTIDENQFKLISALNGGSAEFIMLIFGSPYILAELPKLQNCLLSYCDDEFSISAQIRALFGEIEVSGRLPVRVSDAYPFGYGG